ncbi:ATP binding domain 4 [Maudiozyma exigua]|uniref:Diphthine--ammonia ligase n=1 Tax=Maudiozyma exigua TaxID=34358 RepID=A0A9P6W2K7_MAUEX|nr:ATP binding domain 4 [Kazachstania exigua]
MKFVALVSGGKDSCYNIIHCLKQGHELSAIANLYPSTNVQELDSFMFQTVGFDIVEQYTKCIKDVPLFRQPIEKDTSKNTSLNYVETNDDEIEELYTLLSKVKSEIPDIEAVSVGAIFSSYQRTRVENVCNRLDLIALSYLWQRPQKELMDEMCLMSKQENELTDSQCAKLDARIIKVAAIGLDDSHLGKTLPQISPIMNKLNRMYDVHICGEGGEFESMVIDAPFFDGGYLELEDVVRDTESNNNDDGVYSAKLKVNFKERILPVDYLKKQLQILPTPSLFDSKWQDLLNELNISDISTVSEESLFPECEEIVKWNDTILNCGSLIYISNLRCSDKNQTTIEEQTENIFDHLEKLLEECDCCQSQILNSSLILSDMSHFSTVNTLYNNFFNTSRWGPLPPSRSCIGSNKLGGNTLVQLSVIINKDHKLRSMKEDNKDKVVTVNDDKNGLHVQGRSYWAPCNIGPYSQATWSNKDMNQLTYISGQIALNSCDMSMIGATDKTGQSVLSLKHFDTLKQTINAKHQLSMTCYVSKEDMVDVVSNTWRLYCSEMEVVSDYWMDKEEDLLESLIIVKVSELPRKALCEWGGVACKELKVINDYDSDSSSDVNIEEVLLNFATNIEGLAINEATSRTKISSEGSERVFVTMFCDTTAELLIFLKSLKSNAQITMYFNPTTFEDAKSFYSCELASRINVCPADRIFDCFGTEHQFGLHITTALTT